MKDLLEALEREAKRFGPTLARTAFDRGLAVTLADGGERPIPMTATPVVLGSDEIRRRCELSRLLSSAACRMARAILGGPRSDLLLGALSPLERELALAGGQGLSRLVTTRVDYFVADRPYALELNATIPAMQGYSDIAAASFIEVVGRHFGMKDAMIGGLIARNGSNTLALYRALLEAYRAERGDEPRRVALLCRRNDAQLTEQRYLCERFREFGADAEVVFPDEVSAGTRFVANGRSFDLVYRHLFVRRLEETPALAVADLLRDPRGKSAVVQNPPASQLEVKTTFALLSEASAKPELATLAGLTDEELAAVRSAIPWTRRFLPGPESGPTGESFLDLVEEVAASPKEFVLKRAWDYGGKAVFLGSSIGEPGFQSRVQEAYGREMEWPELCRAAARDPKGGGFVVQQIVRTSPEHHLLLTEGQCTPADLYVDFSTYASVGLERNPAWGGVCRGSTSRIVNIVGGGGVLPLITTEVAEVLLTAYRARLPPR